MDKLLRSLILFLSFLWISFAQEFIVKIPQGSNWTPPEGWRVKDRFKNYLLVEITESLENAQLKSLTLSGEIEYIARNVKLYAFAVPSDPLYESQWHHRLINSERLWDLSLDCSSIVVAVIDTGVDYRHEDLKDNIWQNTAECNGTQGVDDDNNGYVDDCRGWDFQENDNDPQDPDGHGTHVAGLVGAVGNNSEGVTGVCWRAKLMPVRILDQNGVGTVYDFLKGVTYAVENGAKVIVSSLGTCPVGARGCSITDTSDRAIQLLKDAVELARNRGVILVTASGNEGVNTDAYPVYPGAFSKDYENVINVTSIDGDGKLSFFSNFGAQTVDVAVPGGFLNYQQDPRITILSTYPQNDYKYFPGTSMAAPLVAGAVAHLLSAEPFLSPREVKLRIIGATTKNSCLEGKVKSGGVLNICKLIADEAFCGNVDFRSDCSVVEPEPPNNSGGCSSLSLGPYTLALLVTLILFRIFKYVYRSR